MATTEYTFVCEKGPVYCAFISDGEYVVAAAPYIRRWTMGKRVDDIVKQMRAEGWKVNQVQGEFKI